MNDFPPLMLFTLCLISFSTLSGLAFLFCSQSCKYQISQFLLLSLLLMVFFFLRVWKMWPLSLIFGQGKMLLVGVSIKNRAHPSHASIFIVTLVGEVTQLPIWLNGQKFQNSILPLPQASKSSRKMSPITWK